MSKAVEPVKVKVQGRYYPISTPSSIIKDLVVWLNEQLLYVPKDFDEE